MKKIQFGGTLLYWSAHLSLFLFVRRAMISSNCSALGVSSWFQPSETVLWNQPLVISFPLMEHLLTATLTCTWSHNLQFAKCDFTLKVKMYSASSVHIYWNKILEIGSLLHISTGKIFIHWQILLLAKEVTYLLWWSLCISSIKVKQTWINLLSLVSFMQLIFIFTVLREWNVSSGGSSRSASIHFYLTSSAGAVAALPLWSKAEF